MNGTVILALLVGYLLGSIPFGLLLTRAAGKGDIRDVGSGNIGATNVLRTGSKGLAAATLLLDAVKGAVAVIVAQRLWPDAVNFAAAGAMIGHLYPVWLRFKGGKGVATFLGVLVPLLPIAALVYAVVWVGLLLILRISSVAGMAAAASAPVTAAIMGEQALFPMLLGFALLVIWKHQGKYPAIGQGRGATRGPQASVSTPSRPDRPAAADPHAGHRPDRLSAIADAVRKRSRRARRDSRSRQPGRRQAARDFRKGQGGARSRGRSRSLARVIWFSARDFIRERWPNWKMHRRC